jgi:alginate O-acetyltransferase complex protein AlgI
MNFTSLNFLIFFPVLIIVYLITPPKFRWIVLLISSYFFYISLKPIYAVLTAGITLSTYTFTRLIGATKKESRKKTFFTINIVLILLPLFFFKYFGEINEGIIKLLTNYHLHWPLPSMKWILPIGISFYTFMAIGYTIDVYNDDIEIEKNIGILALFISFFPLVLSGPIERAKNMIPQFKSKRKIEYSMVSNGIKLMAWGYFMKLVVADRVGLYVDAVFSNIHYHTGITLLIASFLYPFQVYADLGGYSLIAIGTSSILGFKVMSNFNRPFFATSMAELWRRWHMSLITWLKDYLYTPLTFSFRKYGIWGVVIALMITFMLSGIWHGAALTFIVWGTLQGLLLSVEALTSKRRTLFAKRFNLHKKVWYNSMGICITFLLFVGSMIFGRATSINEALVVYKKIFTEFGLKVYKGDVGIFMFAVMGVFILILNDFLGEYYPNFKLLRNTNRYISFFSFLFLVMYIVSFGVFDSGQFIYFKF